MTAEPSAAGPAAVVGSRAARLESASVAALAETWRVEGPSLDGLDLLALVWWIARDVGIAVRPLGRKIVRDIQPSRLLSPSQRAALFGPCDLPESRSRRGRNREGPAHPGQ